MKIRVDNEVMECDRWDECDGRVYLYNMEEIQYKWEVQPKTRWWQKPKEPYLRKGNYHEHHMFRMIRDWKDFEVLDEGPKEAR